MEITIKNAKVTGVDISIDVENREHTIRIENGEFGISLADCIRVLKAIEESNDKSITIGLEVPKKGSRMLWIQNVLLEESNPTFTPDFISSLLESTRQIEECRKHDGQEAEPDF